MNFSVHCKNSLGLGSLSSTGGLKLADEFYYTSFPLAVLDAIFSIQAKYASAQNVVKNYCDSCGLKQFDRSRSTPEYDKHTASDLLGNIEKAGGVEEFAAGVLKNNQKIAGRLKAQNLYEWALIFQKHGIETFSDFNNRMNGSGKAVIEKDLKAVKGQGGDAVALSYLYMLCGDDDICKPDTHLIRFLSNAVGTVKASDVQAIMTEAVNELKQSFPDLTVRLLDYTIWNYQKNLP